MKQILIGSFIGLLAGMTLTLGINYLYAQEVPIIEGETVDPTGAPIIDTGPTFAELPDRSYLNREFIGTNEEIRNYTLIYGRLDYMVKQLNDLRGLCD